MCVDLFFIFISEMFMTRMSCFCCCTKGKYHSKDTYNENKATFIISHTKNYDYSLCLLRKEGDSMKIICTRKNSTFRPCLSFLVYHSKISVIIYAHLLLSLSFYQNSQTEGQRNENFKVTMDGHVNPFHYLFHLWEYRKMLSILQ